MDTKALRQKVLDLAIRGKLVPQDPNDEPASVLLERIRQQKQQMVKDGKLKAKDIKNDTIIFVGEDNLHYEKFADGSVKCIEDEIPFELPDGWAWARLGTIANIVTGRLDANAQSDGGEFPFFTCGEEVLRTDTFAFDCNAVLLGGNNAVGDFKMHKFSGRFNAYQRVYVISAYGNIITDYLYNHIRYYLPRLQEQSIGSQTRYLKLGMVTDLLIALPPITEQERIANNANNLLSQCSCIDLSNRQIEKLIGDVKSRILDLAIRGQLVPQNPDDEPASVLLERIRSEKEELIRQGKIKRDKKESVIFRGEDNSYYLNDGTSTIDISEELPFDIPDSWCWGRLKDIVMINPRNKLDDDTMVAFIPMPLIEDGYSGRHTSEVRKWKEVKTGFTHFQEGDVGVAKITPCFENRKSAIFQNLCNGFGAGTTELHVFRPYNGTILPQYLLAYMKSAQFVENGKQTFSGAVGQQRLSKEYVENAYFPIPPMEEQKRIVHQLGIVFKHLNSISDSLS